MIMYLFVVLLVVCVVDESPVSCETDLVSPEDEDESRNVKNVQKRSVVRNDDIVFCKNNCVLYDPDHPALIDDPGRNFYDTFSVLSASYVIEVVGGTYDLSGLRVMLSDTHLGRYLSGMSAGLRLSDRHRGTLVLTGPDIMQRITFDLHTKFEIRADPTATEEFVVVIPDVVPNVLFLHGYRLEHDGRRADGVVAVDAWNLPMSLEVLVGRLEDGRCWMKPLDRGKFKDYMIGVRVRGNDRNVIGVVFTAVQTYLEAKFPFGIYMQEVNEFAFRFLEESLLQTKSVIKESKLYMELCKTISRDPQKPK